MPYKSGTWGEEAKERGRNRTVYFREYKRKRDKVKVNARAKVERAIKKGLLQVLPCEKIGLDCRGKMEAHHHDYSKPLEINWLCSFHHRMADRLLGLRK